MKQTIRNQSGFTLIEMLIVVIILGILSMIIIPQIAVSTDDAKVNTLRTNLTTVRSAIELYYHQHDQTYPGAVKTDGTGAATVAGDLPAALVDQLTKYTQLNGKADGDSTALVAPIYGPYLKTVALPENPYNLSKVATCDIVTTDVTTRTAVPADGTGWRYYVKTGVFIANDSLAHDDY
ncbi:MAG: type II secretion system protein [Desulfobacterales bacterium]|jgi:general secretion pathway protein G